MSSGFISETEIAEAKRKRQEEWEKVRTPDQPEEAPEEAPFDPRPLYQRLEEQKNKRDADYEEAHKLKNMIRGLDDDEVGFLELVEQSKASVARQISLEEQREMREFRERVHTVQDTAERERLAQISGVRQSTTAKRSPVNNTRNKLQGLIVRKRKASETETSKVDQPPSKNGNSVPNGASDYQTNGNVSDECASPPADVPAPSLPAAATVNAELRCVGILPGIGPYSDSSDSDASSDSDRGHPAHDHFDMWGRKEECKKTEEKS